MVALGYFFTYLPIFWQLILDNENYKKITGINPKRILDLLTEIEDPELFKMIRIAVLVSGSGTNLQSLIDAYQNNEFNGEIALVVSNRKKAYGLERAKNANIKAMHIKDEDLLIQTLKDEKIDLRCSCSCSSGYDGGLRW